MTTNKITPHAVDAVIAALEMAIGYPALVAKGIGNMPILKDRAKDDCRILGESIQMLESIKNTPNGPAADAVDTLMLIMNAHCESNDIDMPDDEDGAMVSACVRDIKQANDVDSFRESLIKEFTRLKSGQSVRDELYLAGVIAVIQTHGKEDEQP